MSVINGNMISFRFTNGRLKMDMKKGFRLTESTMMVHILLKIAGGSQWNGKQTIVAQTIWLHTEERQKRLLSGVRFLIVAMP